jgi:hypothetical protein
MVISITQFERISLADKRQDVNNNRPPTASKKRAGLKQEFGMPDLDNPMKAVQ